MKALFDIFSMIFMEKVQFVVLLYYLHQRDPDSWILKFLFLLSLYGICISFIIRCGYEKYLLPSKEPNIKEFDTNAPPNASNVDTPNADTNLNADTEQVKELNAPGDSVRESYLPPDKVSTSTLGDVFSSSNG